MQTFLLSFVFASIGGIAMEVPNTAETHDLVFKKIVENEYFDVLEANTGMNLQLSQNDSEFHVVETFSTNGYRLYKVNPIQNNYCTVNDLENDSKKDLAVTGKWIVRWAAPPAEYRAIKQVLDFDDRRLFFFRHESIVAIMDSQNQFLMSFNLKGLWDSSGDATTFRNGDFALMKQHDGSRFIYYGLNKKPFVKTYPSTYKLIKEAYEKHNFKKINELFSYAVFQNLFTASVIGNEIFNLREKDICLFRGSILLHIALEARHWSREDWSRVDKEKILEPIKNTNKFVVKYRVNDQHNDDLFKAVDEGNVKKIDKLVKIGIKLELIKNADGQTPSQFAHSKKLYLLETPLKESLYWRIFDKKQLAKELKQLKEDGHRNNPLIIGTDLRRSINNFIDSLELGLIDDISWEIFHALFTGESNMLPVERLNGKIIYWILQNDHDFMVKNFNQERWPKIESSKLFENIRDVIPQEYLYMYLTCKEINALYTWENFADNKKISEKISKEYSVAQDDITNLFLAIDQHDVKEIDRLIKEKGIILAKVKNKDGLTPFEYALKSEQEELAFALRDNLYWYIFKKEMLPPKKHSEKKEAKYPINTTPGMGRLKNTGERRLKTALQPKNSTPRSHKKTFRQRPMTKPKSSSQNKEKNNVEKNDQDSTSI